MKPKLTLRDLFWLVLVAASLCGWWVDHRKISTAARENHNFWIEECNCRFVKSLWLRDWIESNNLGKVEGLEVLFDDMTVTAIRDGESRTFRWDRPENLDLRAKLNAGATPPLVSPPPAE